MFVLRTFEISLLFRSVILFFVISSGEIIWRRISLYPFVIVFSLTILRCVCSLKSASRMIFTPQSIIVLRAFIAIGRMFWLSSIIFSARPFFSNNLLILSVETIVEGSSSAILLATVVFPTP